jgi:nitric oxide reductase large subunit
MACVRKPRLEEMETMDNLALRFIRWSAGLLMLGLVTGYGPLAHYLHGGVAVACPWAPIHGHVALLGWLGMAVFGLVYKVLPSWANGAPASLGLARAHFYACVVGVLGVLVNGIVGYRILDFFSDGFYYEPQKAVLNLWLSIDGMFLSLYGMGCGLFLVVVLGSTRYAPRAAAVEGAKAPAV